MNCWFEGKNLERQQCKESKEIVCKSISSSERRNIRKCERNTSEGKNEFSKVENKSILKFRMKYKRIKNLFNLQGLEEEKEKKEIKLE